MDRKTALLLVVIVILLAIIGVFSWYFFTSHPTATPGTATSTAATTTPTTPLLTNAAANHIIQNGQYFTIDLQYPSATPLAQTIGSAADEAAVATLKNYSEQTASTFITDADIASITPTVAEDIGLSATNKFSLTGTYDTYTSPSTVSYVFTVSADTFGAHPNSRFNSYTFDLKTGKVLSLGDLFSPGTNYLNQLSTISRKLLVQKLGTQIDEKTFIDPGTAPTVANFSSFAVNGQNLVLFFSPYQVAPYSSGPQSVSIPVSELQGFSR